MRIYKRKPVDRREETTDRIDTAIAGKEGSFLLVLHILLVLEEIINIVGKVRIP